MTSQLQPTLIVGFTPRPTSESTVLRCSLPITTRAGFTHRLPIGSSEYMQLRSCEEPGSCTRLSRPLHLFHGHDGSLLRPFPDIGSSLGPIALHVVCSIVGVMPAMPLSDQGSSSRTIPGRLFSLFTERCHAATVDCLEVAAHLSRRKLVLLPLGVDTDRFTPRLSWNGETPDHSVDPTLASDPDIVCIYTGRYGVDKNPLILPRPFELFRRGMFGSCHAGSRGPPVTVSSGRLSPQPSDYWLRTSPPRKSPCRCSTPPPDYRRNDVQAKERYEGNGVTYQDGDVEDLVATLVGLRDPDYRTRLGQVGSRRMKEQFSWRAHAARRVADYERARLI